VLVFVKALLIYHIMA